MGLNISQTMNNSNFERKEFLQNAAKNILKRQNVSDEKAQHIIEQTIFSSPSKFPNAQMTIFNTSAQITLNNSLKETLKYLKEKEQKKTVKKHVLGELKNLISLNDSVYEGELADFEIDFNNKNIFKAA